MLCILTNSILLKFISTHEHMTVHLCAKIISIDGTKAKKLFSAKVLKNLAFTFSMSTAQKMKFFIKNIFSKYDQIRSFL